MLVSILPKLFLGLLLLSGLERALVAEEIDLSGKWSFRLDPKNAGIGEGWFEQQLEGTITLPGSIQAQGIGLPAGPDSQWIGNVREEEWDKPKYAPYRSKDNFKMPFWLQPDRCYTGAAWFRKTIDIPAGWIGRHVTLMLERPHWKTTLWIDGREVGSQLFLSAPHVYDVSSFIQAGRNVCTIRVENGLVLNVGQNSHSVSDHTQSNWNGIAGSLKLEMHPAVWIEKVQIYPDIRGKRLRAEVDIGARTGSGGKGEIIVYVSRPSPAGAPFPRQRIPVEWDAKGGKASCTYSLGEQVKPWDEFDPQLYVLEVELISGKDQPDRHSISFGFREVSTRGTQIVINDRPVFLRGTLECAIFPLTGYPPTESQAWKRIIRICKDHGLNHMRFHSWCPPEAAFLAADELGFYFQVECSTWSNQGAALGNGSPLDQWCYQEADRILAAYGNHPSFLLFAQGNEPAGLERGGAYLSRWVRHYREKDSRRLITSASGWPQIEENDYHVTPKPRIQQWGQGLGSRINSLPPATLADYLEIVDQYPRQPIIAHEIGQWCVYPDLDEISKYSGVLKPKNFEIFREFLSERGLLDQAQAFLMASGKLQLLCYKEEIESALRTPGFAGFQLLDLHDFPGQGTALVGVLDPFWDSKPYVSPAEYRRFCNSTVPLARIPQRTFRQKDVLQAVIEVSHFGPGDLEGARVAWSLREESGAVAASGRLGPLRIRTGQVTGVGVVDVALDRVRAPAKLIFTAGIEGRDIENSWDLWVYPSQVDSGVPDDLTVAHRLDDRTASLLSRGGKVLLLADPKEVQTDVVLGFSSIFWNTVWTGGQPPHTLGVLCDPRHPALARFPTEYHSNWQWWELISQAATMEMDGLPAGLRPLIQIVPDWFSPGRLGLAFEARCGAGRLLVCSIDLDSNPDRRPAALQLRHSLVNYMASDAFEPGQSVSIEDIRRLFTGSDREAGLPDQRR